MNILITVPDLRLQGGVASIYRSIKWEKTNKVDYFFNTAFKSSAKAWFIPVMIFHFIKRIRKVKLVQFNPSLDAKAVIRDGFLLLLAKLFNKKILVFFHGWEDEFENVIVNNFIYKKIFQKVFNMADAYCLLGVCFKEKLIKMGVSVKSVVYLPTVADDRYLLTIKDNKNKTSEKTISLLFLSRFVPLKGMDIVLEAYSYLKTNAEGFKFELTMAGDGPQLASCKEFVTKQNLQHVTFTGYVNGIAKHNCLKNADILFFPSYSEGLPCVIMEAMLYGLPIVSRPVGGIPDWVKQNENGWLSESFDPEVFAKGIMSLVLQPQLLKKMGENNQRTAKAFFTPAAFKQQLQHIYNQILHEHI